MNKKSPRPSFSRRSDLHKKTKKNKRSRVWRRNAHVLAAALVVFAVITGILVWRIMGKRAGEAFLSGQGTEQETGQAAGKGPAEWQAEGAPYIDVQLLTPNEYSRPQLSMGEVQYIAIHYTANPGSSAQANRDYFENLAWSHETKVSSHFVVGLEGEVIQCIPTAEISYATNERNVDAISIENCHPDESGVFNEATYESTVKLAAWLCTRFGLTEENVIRHYDVTGKECPKYYVDNPAAWEQMKADIRVQIDADYELQKN